MSLRFLLCVLAVQAFAASGQAKQPNIILVMPDDAGYGDYACLGNPVMRTPSVDAFKKQSLLFTRFHVSPTCAPCRGALMSGRHEFRSGITHTIGGRERMALSTYTLPQMLRSAGYATGIFGKWHLGDEEAYRPENRGFDEVYIHGSGGIGQSGDAPSNSNHDPTLWHNGKFVRTKGYCTDLFFAQAIRWMEQRHEADKPFFAYVSLNAPHAPHVLPEEYYRHYLGKPGVHEERAKFFGMIENIDTNFGKLLKRLDEWDIANNTLVIYLGTDNGGTAGRNFFNADLRGGKTMPYQGGTRSPCFVRWPAGGVLSGVECDALTAHVDLFPTFAKLAGATLAPAVEKQLEGRSLVPLLENPKAKWSVRTLVHHVGRWPKGQASDFKYTKYSVQNADFTLVNNEELYDLKNDPGETRNVIAEHPKVVAELRAAYEKWWAEVQPYFANEDTTGFNHLTFRELYEKQFGKAATVAALGRSKELRAKRDKKESPGSDATDPESLRRLREERRRRREVNKPVSAKPSGIYAQTDKDWMAEVPDPDPTPANDDEVVITVSDEVTLHTEEWKRRDPSDIIRVGDAYYVWYAKIHEDTPGFPGGWCATTHYATSKDGIDWVEQGIAVGVGEPGAWDDRGAYTPNVLSYKGKYYLAYTGLKGPFNKKYCQASIGMAVADSPDGPWKKLGNNPIISPTDSFDAPDGFLCDDTVFVVKDGKIWLYYKGYAKGSDPKTGQAMRVRGTYLLVATADKPEGPYKKHGKILHRGHEAVVWKNPDGSVGSFCTGHGPALYYESKDGFKFKATNPIIRQKAIGIYRADFEEGNPGAKPTWGISAINNRQGLGLRRIEIKWPKTKK